MPGQCFSFLKGKDFSVFGENYITMVILYFLYESY